METVDEATVDAPIEVMFRLVREVELWPGWLTHYRYVRFRTRAADGGGEVEMSANRPFGILNWPTWWLSEMSVDDRAHVVRFRHIGGVTRGMDVEWRLESIDGATRVRLLHVWDGPPWPVIGVFAAIEVIGPVFIHGIASRTLAGLAREAEARGRGGASASAGGRSRLQGVTS